MLITDFPVEKRTCEFLHSVLTECLNNGIRHGEATQFFVHLTYDTAHIKLVVSDNGKGLEGSSDAEKKKRLEKFNEQLEDALLAMSSSLKAGFSINQALESVAGEKRNPISFEFNLLIQELRLGVTLDQALEKMADRLECPDFDLTAVAILTARQTGGELTSTLERLAAVIRERIRILYPQEVPLGEYRMENKNEQCYVEVKGVTLIVDGEARFLSICDINPFVKSHLLPSSVCVRLFLVLNSLSLLPISIKFSASVFHNYKKFSISKLA